MKKSQSGFTLIELVVVIVLLGILGVTALGKFQDLSGEATTAAKQGVASEISSAAAVNFAKSQVGTSDFAIVAADRCADGTMDKFFAGDFPTSQFSATLVTASPVCTAAGDTYQCLIHEEGVTAVQATDPKATIICTGA